MIRFLVRIAFDITHRIREEWYALSSEVIRVESAADAVNADAQRLAELGARNGSAKKAAEAFYRAQREEQLRKEKEASE
jgi:hypothetical protein